MNSKLNLYKLVHRIAMRELGQHPAFFNDADNYAARRALIESWSNDRLLSMISIALQGDDL